MKNLRKVISSYFNSLTPKTQERKPPLPASAPRMQVRRVERMEDFRLHRPGASAEGPLEKAVKEMQRPPKPEKTFQPPHISTPGSSRRPDRGMRFNDAHYDLGELARARDTESLINTSVERHVETAIAQGFRWNSENEEVIKYLNDRVLGLESASKVTFRKILEQLFDQLALYGTAFLVVRRDNQRSDGKPIRLFGSKMMPIASWGVAESSTMSAAENAGGNIIGWKQTIEESSGYNSASKTKFWSPNDVFIFTRHKQAGRVFGRSMYTPALDDALMLRSLEELVYVISQKYAFPIFQYIVGTPEFPAGDIVLDNDQVVSEVELAQEVVESMPAEGGFVTPERHEIKVIGTEGKVLDLSKYLSHFRQRVQDATRMSNAALGTGTGEQSKSTAQTQMQNLEESARYLQDIVSDGFKWLVMMLLAEGGYDISVDNMAMLSFDAPNTEENRARENHVLGLYHGGIINCPEARSELGRECFSQEEEKQTFLNQAHERDKELARVGAAARASQASSAAKSTSNTSKSKTKPTNQSGTKSTKTKVRKNDFATEINKIWSDSKTAALAHKPVSSEHSLGYNRIISPFVDQMASKSKRYLGSAIDSAITQARLDTEDSTAFVTLQQRKMIFHEVRQYFKRYMSSVVGKGFNDGNKVWINAAFSSAKIKHDELVDKLPEFVYRSAYIACLNNMGFSKVKIIDKETNHSVTIGSEKYSSKIVFMTPDNHSIEAIQ